MWHAGLNMQLIGPAKTLQIICTTAYFRCMISALRRCCTIKLLYVLTNGHNASYQQCKYSGNAHSYMGTKADTSLSILQDRGCVTVCDFNPEMVQEGRARPGPTFRLSALDLMIRPPNVTS